MLKNEFTVFVCPESRGRYMIVGTGARSMVPQTAVEQDAGSFRPHFLMAARERFEAETGQSLVLEFLFQRLDTEGLSDNFQGWEEDRYGAASWVSMGSRRLVNATVTVDGEKQGWGSLFDVLGLEFRPGNKGFKRLNELTRPSRIWTETEPRMLCVSDVDDDRFADEALYDGAIIMRRSWAVESVANVLDFHDRIILMHRLRNGEIGRAETFRCLTEFGLIKGHAIIVDDEILDAHWGEEFDLVLHETNIKTELRFNTERYFTTWEPLKATGEVSHDFQTKSWMKNFLDRPAEQKALQTGLLDEVTVAMANGEIPEWALFNPDPYLRSRPRTDPWGEERDPHANEVLARNWLRIGASGVDIRSSATVISLMARGVINHVESRVKPPRITREDPYPDPHPDTQPWSPAPWATYGYVVSRSVLEDLGGLSFDYGSETIFFDPKTESLVVPDAWYKANYENHGGFDQDDRFPLALRYHPEWNCLVLVLWRQPNTLGEWSMVRDFDPYSFGWKNTLGDIPSLDLGFQPPQKQVTIPGGTGLENYSEPTLPEPQWKWGSEYRIADARESIEVAFLNLSSGGVGGYMNALMVANDLGISVNAHATPEQVVDICQATPYREFFQTTDENGVVRPFHQDQVRKMWKTMAVEGGRLDKLLWATKVPENYKGAFELRNGHLFQGYSHALKSINDFKITTRALGLQLRNANALEIISHVEFSDTEQKVAKQAIAWFGKAMAKIARENDLGIVHEGESPYRKASGSLATKILKTFATDYGVDRDRLYSQMLAIYAECLRPTQNMPYGQPDNLLFSPPPSNRTGMLDLMLEALVHYGVANDVQLLRFGFHTQTFDRLDVSEGLPSDASQSEFMLMLGTPDQSMLNQMFAIWAEADSEKEAMEAVRLIALSEAYSE